MGSFEADVLDWKVGLAGFDPELVWHDNPLDQGDVDLDAIGGFGANYARPGHLHIWLRVQWLRRRGNRGGGLSNPLLSWLRAWLATSYGKTYQ